MILVGAAAEQPPCIPVDPGNVKVEGFLRKTQAHPCGNGLRQRVEGRMKNPLIGLFVFLKPGTFIMKAQFPEEIRGFPCEALKDRILSLG